MLQRQGLSVQRQVLKKSPAHRRKAYCIFKYMYILPTNTYICSKYMYILPTNMFILLTNTNLQAKYMYCTFRTNILVFQEIYILQAKIFLYIYTYIILLLLYYIYICTCRQNIHICRQNLRIFPPSITLDCPIPCTSKSHSAKSCSIS